MTRSKLVKNLNKAPDKSDSGKNKVKEKLNKNSSGTPSQKNMKDSHEHNYSVNDPNVCCGCEDTIGENDDGIQCEVCEYWYCVACSGMTITFYQELVSSEIV